ncbi:hypothetical protein JCM4814A_94670 [Streptomyces phaeofaciens JCM 4814]|uniref:HTH cro/C1-type domain-containing protein n=1 Tax=Streptomyces phaeofaciens TaxID=68254 RepID=A0A918M1R0_9ACTN|nr:helix-turn-helix transcriptional regulator [Streptomyces phaeofaciens]GGT97316.1 hypothetical protein GCM10010226_88410 [Streptomyces phaeofaciens]
MGRTKNPICTDNTARERLALMLRELLEEAGLTFEQLEDRCEGISRATLQRAASGTYTPKEKTLKAFAEGCGFPDASEALLRQRIRVRIEERGILPTLPPPPHLSLVSDWRDLSRAIEYDYEAAGAPSLREIVERGGNTHALSTSTLRRIIMRIAKPVSEQQLLAIVHGLGDTGRDVLWKAAWAKATSTSAPAIEPQPSSPTAPVIRPRSPWLRRALRRGLRVDVSPDGTWAELHWPPRFGSAGSREIIEGEDEVAALLAEFQRGHRPHSTIIFNTQRG